MSAMIESSTMFESFKLRAEGVSAQVHRVASRELALELVVCLLREEGVEDKPNSRAVWAACSMIGPAERKKLECAVPGLNFDVTHDLAAEAKVGISQMDWALANTGTLVQSADAVDTRLVSSLPPLHIALVSTAALLPDLPALLNRVDPRKSAYLSFITGPNRRNEMAHDPRFKQALQCIRCASCLNVCPVFRLVGGHVFGKVYTGGIGTILTAWFDALKQSDEIQSLCIQCGNCKEVCPGKIDIPDLILELRRIASVVVAPRCKTCPIVPPSTLVKRMHHQTLGLNISNNYSVSVQP